MKKISFTIIAILLLLMTLVGCRNLGARTFGGTMEFDLPAGIKLVNITWKDDDLWYLTREMREDEFPEEYRFQASTNWGVFEGTVIIREYAED
jgi:hypothetical protein